ncbi:sigma-70 family RNA polymerase sigma factor [Actinokineospora sp. NBRC 105648]|uniref:sigma-70 family RNA polymerase sigma factor n=1 Tax=Actinokineospora sp. NBRC 105648 TaxID=3032206 RepID=UPI00249FF7F2|nr:sigma-70 family RNA polymerase sigma factor [Actinokineospora sp. NBRC 105648]GLZ36742.1 DNA-directed RNA polymerase sigma-70 factor [Actinokineospora sp. NBRC 105648]
MSEQEWFEQLYRSGYRRLVLSAYAVLGDLGEAEEVAQEAFAVGYRKRSTLAAADSPEAWLRTVAVNAARRRAKRRAMLDRIMFREPALGLVAAAGEYADLHDAIRGLPVDQRSVVVLHYLADLPVAEIAELLGIAPGTVKSRLSRARQCLAERLDIRTAEVDRA